MKILILGESGEHPWFDGQSSRRLWRWFDVNSHAELVKLATLMNVYTKKGSHDMVEKHYARLRDAIVEHDVVFLVGKVAQRQVFRDCIKLRAVLWHQDKYVGLPHPSGLNRQLNNMRDKVIREFIISMMQQYLNETQGIINRVLKRK